jgi:hypothetical protein
MLDAVCIKNLNIIYFKIYFLGEFLEWNIATNVNHPFDYGFVAGLNYDGSFAYVGLTYYVRCPFFADIISSVTRVSTDPTKPGSFMECYNSTYGYEIYQNETEEIYVYMRSTRMTWKYTTVANVRNVLGYREMFNRIHYYTAARYQMSNWTMIGRVRIN